MNLSGCTTVFDLHIQVLPFYKFQSELLIMLPAFSVSDDDEIDYSTKPEFYDPDLDDKDELWVQNKRKGPISDAVLSCPACFTTLCLECQRCI